MSEEAIHGNPDLITQANLTAKMRNDEVQDNIRLRKMKEALEFYTQQENAARIELARAVATKKEIKERYDALFIECERRAAARRKQGFTPSPAFSP